MKIDVSRLLRDKYEKRYLAGYERSTRVTACWRLRYKYKK